MHDLNVICFKKVPARSILVICPTAYIDRTGVVKQIAYSDRKGQLIASFFRIIYH